MSSPRPALMSSPGPVNDNYHGTPPAGGAEPEAWRVHYVKAGDAVDVASRGEGFLRATAVTSGYNPARLPTSGVVRITAATNKYVSDSGVRLAHSCGTETRRRRGAGA